MVDFHAEQGLTGVKRQNTLAVRFFGVKTASSDVKDCVALVSSVFEQTLLLTTII